MNVHRNISVEKKRTLFIILCGIFVTNALLAEVIGVKIFSAEAFLGIPPAQLKLPGGNAMDFNLTAGVIIWPIVFITTDIINEYFGRDGVRKISILTALLISYAFVVIWFVTTLPPAAFWTDLYKNQAGIDINTAFSLIFRQGLGIIIGSVTAFLIGQLLDAHIFHLLKKFTGSKRIWLRATGSTLISQLIDSFVVLIVAFYIFGNWSLNQVISVSIINYIYKCIAAIVLTPLLYIAHGLIDRYLGAKMAVKMVQEADELR